jgi:Ser/Thr protein kinase RdoA (MazF antagonist)
MPVDFTEKLLRVLDEFYDIGGSLSRLPGENVNFLLNDGNGHKFIVKIVHDELPSELIEMEFAALKHLERAQTGLSLPKINENKNGNYETRFLVPLMSPMRLRVLDYIEGDNLEDIADISEKMRFDMGEMLARFDQTMSDFDHPASHRTHAWDLATAGQHADKIELVTDPVKQDLLRWAFTQFTKQVSPVLPTLNWQFTHGDANPENIRVKNGKITGLFDFGDSCHNPIACELAICTAYQMMDQADPWSTAQQVINGFESVMSVSDEEKAILLPLICARLAVTITIAAKRRTLDGDHANWFVSEQSAWDLLFLIRQSGRSVIDGK